MVSKQEIKDLFVAELLNTPQYQTVLDIKRVILNEIATPNVQPQVFYTFDNPITDVEMGIIQMCIKVEFGFDVTNISNRNVVIDMAKFLD